MPKKTRLDDSAEIYNRHREEQSEKEKWKSMTPKEKYSYFKTYYLTKVLVGIAIFACAASLIYTMVKPKPDTLLYAAIIDYAMTDEMLDTVEAGFSEYISLDPQTQDLIFDNSFLLSSQTDYSVQQKFSAYLFAGELDVMIGGETQMQRQIQSGNLAPLSEQLPTELFSALKDYFVYGSIAETDSEGNIVSLGEEEVYGLYLDDCEIYQNLSLRERPDLGIVVNSDMKENAVAFIQYLFGL